MIKRILMACGGFTIIGFGVAIMRVLELGVDPFGAFAVGLSNLSGLSFAIILLLLHSPIFIVMLWKTRRLIGAGTVLGMFGIGLMVDLFYYAVRLLPMEIAGLHLAVRLVILAAMLVIFSFGIALYMVADIGIVPYDAIGVVAEDLTGGRLKFKWVRLTMDGICALAAFLLGATLGIATVLTVFCLGPFISFFRERLTR